MADRRGVSRRDFLKASGALAAAGVIGGCATSNSGDGSQGGPQGPAVQIIVDPADPVAATPQAQWALGRFRNALGNRSVKILGPEVDAARATVVVTVAAMNSSVARQAMDYVRAKPAWGTEALAVVPLKGAGSPGLLISGADGNGLTYALNELTEAIQSEAPLSVLTPKEAVVEKAANKVRSICRVFVSEEEDKPWYYDLDGWRQYLDMLVLNRFNKFNLSLGLAYDFSDNVVDGYFYFAYPFFLRVAGYDVRAVDRTAKPLSDAEQDRNLATLQFISKQAANRGIHFQLGLWTHSIKWPLTAGVTANYTLTGITPATQATYSRDALKTLLEACPDIKGVTIRTHGESGVPEGDISLWKTVFDGTKDLSGNRKVQIDLHAKGVTFEIIDAARATGNPVIVTPKFWAEHNGLPYIPASIRAWELPKANGQSQLMALSTGSRNHMRYGYGDILIKDRQYGVVTRVFPGTQRFLLWGDPVYAREYAKIFSFGNMDGVEWFEPLAFKGRQGTGMAKNRGCYADAALKPHWPDQMDKYEYTFRLWGRTAYNPDVSDDVLLRKLAADHTMEAGRLESILGPASRILPLVTSAHSPSAAQANFWPEIYTNMSHHDATHPTYSDDTPSPKVFGTVSSLDPQLIANVNECADALLAGKGIGKITVSEIADQLSQWAGAVRGTMLIRDSRSAEAGPAPTTQRRAMIDASLASAMGDFWAAKFRTGLLYAIFDKSGHELARQAALVQYEKARNAMAIAAQLADSVYIQDISFGADRKIRGTFADRLPHIDNDIAGMRSAMPRGISATPAAAAAALAAAGAKTPRPAAAIMHTVPPTFDAGKPLAIELTAAHGVAELTVRLWYRHINQAETYKSVDMQAGAGNAFGATIPGDYTQSPYGLQYYFEIHAGAAGVGIHPGFREDFLGTPYFVVLQPNSTRPPG